MAQERVRSQAPAASKEIHLAFARIYIWLGAVLLLVALGGGIILNLSQSGGSTGPGGSGPLAGSLTDSAPVANLGPATRNIVTTLAVTPLAGVTLSPATPTEITIPNTPTRGASLPATAISGPAPGGVQNAAPGSSIQ